MKAIDHELELTTRGVLATEDWAEGYSKAPKQHAQLIKNTAKLHRQVLVYFRDLANEASSFVDWYAYARAVIEQKNALKASANGQRDFMVRQHGRVAELAVQRLHARPGPLHRWMYHNRYL